MLYYDDRDYLDYDNIDDLYDDEDPDAAFEDYEEDSNVVNEWEYDYHRMTNELVDE